MKKAIAIFFILTAMVAGKVMAQDPQFSQYYSAPLYLNPAFAGSTDHHRAAAIHRTQWPALPQAFVTYAFSYDMNLKAVNSGFGVMITTDKAGSAGLRSTQIGLQYAYKVQLRDRWVFSPALSFGYGLRDINIDKLLFGDQLEFGSRDDIPPSLDPTVKNIGGTSFFDFGMGFLLYNKNLWVGASAYHVNEPNYSMLGNTSTIPMKVTVHGGFRFHLNQGVRKADRVASLAPSFLYKSQGRFDQLDVGMQFQYFPIMVGFWYRGIPIQQNVMDNADQDAVSFIFGLMFEQMNVNYSYDMTVSELGADIGGAHEVSIIFEWSSRDMRKIKRKEKFIPCPTF
ncbi:MAG: type IX secretion system membrane protein PorP/SprF [Cyclobacteriaceae bacterium]